MSKKKTKFGKSLDRKIKYGRPVLLDGIWSYTLYPPFKVMGGEEFLIMRMKIVETIYRNSDGLLNGK